MAKEDGVSKDRQIEIFEKYCGLTRKEIETADANADYSVFTTLLNNLFHAVSDFRVSAEDAHDVSAIMWAYAHIVGFDAEEYIQALKTSSSIECFFNRMIAKISEANPTDQVTDQK